jgi:hypothetical protein
MMMIAAMGKRKRTVEVPPMSKGMDKDRAKDRAKGIIRMHTHPPMVRARLASPMAWLLLTAVPVPIPVAVPVWVWV